MSTKWSWSGLSGYVEIMVGDLVIFRGKNGSDKNKSGSDTFSYPLCQPNEVHAILTRYYDDNANQESFKLYKGTSSSGNLIMYKPRNGIEGSQRYSICLEPNQSYYIEYFDSGNDGWNEYSYIDLTIGDLIYYKGSLGSGSSGSDTFIYSLCQSNEVQAVLFRKYT